MGYSFLTFRSFKCKRPAEATHVRITLYVPSRPLPPYVHMQREKGKQMPTPPWVWAFQVWKIPASSPGTAMLWLLIASPSPSHQPPTQDIREVHRHHGDSGPTAAETCSHFTHLHHWDRLGIFIFIISQYWHPFWAIKCTWTVWNQSYPGIKP